MGQVQISPAEAEQPLIGKAGAKPRHDHQQEPGDSVDLDLKTFLDEMQPRLRGTLSQFRIPIEDAEDVVQQAMLALVYQWGEIRDPEAWLIGTVRNKCLIYWRERRRRVYSSVDTILLDWLSEAKNPSQTRVEIACDLTSLINKLPRRCREILRLRYSLGYRPAEIAERLGYRRSSISKITSRCMAGLLDQMVRCGYCPPQDGKPASDSAELSEQQHAAD